MSTWATVGELREAIRTLDDQTPVLSAGFEGSGLIGWVNAVKDDQPVLLLAMNTPTCIECPECGREVDTRTARAL